MEKKLKGFFALVRMSGRNWLMIKMNDEQADRRKNIVKSEPSSVKSGMTVHELQKESSGTMK